MDGPVKLTVGAIAKPSPIDDKYQQKNWNLNRIYQWKYLHQNHNHHVTCIIVNRQSKISIRNNMTQRRAGWIKNSRSRKYHHYEYLSQRNRSDRCGAYQHLFSISISSSISNITRNRIITIM